MHDNNEPLNLTRPVHVAMCTVVLILVILEITTVALLTAAAVDFVDWVANWSLQLKR